MVDDHNTGLENLAESERSRFAARPNNNPQNIQAEEWCEKPRNIAIMVALTALLAAARCYDSYKNDQEVRAPPHQQSESSQTNFTGSVTGNELYKKGYEKNER